MEWIIAGLIGLIGTIISVGVQASQHNAQVSQAQEQAKLAEEQLKIAQQNVDDNKEVATQNLGLQKEQFEYQKYLNQLQMQREDTAIQRQVSDLKAAGLSPLMASGGSATGQLISGTAPQMNMQGINSAVQSLLGARQDYAGRKQQAYMFERQQTMQMAQMSQNLISSYLDNKEKISRITGQDIANVYNAEHGIRDPNLQSAIVDFIMSYMNSKNVDPGKLVDDALDSAKKGVSNAGKTMSDNANKTLNIITDTLGNSAGAVGRTYKGAWNDITNYVKSSKPYSWYQNVYKKHLEKQAQRKFKKAAKNW